MNHICPYCGEPLPEEAAFCPACAKSVNQRVALKPPDLTWRRLLHRALPVLFLLIALLLLAGAAAGYYRASQPQTYDGLGEVFYSDSEGSYHLFFPSLDGSPEPAENNPFHAVRGIHAVRGTAYRYPVPLSITDADSGTNAGESFLQKVDWFSAQFSTTSGASFNVSCTQPEARPDLFPDAALVSLVDFSTEAAFTDSMIWTFQMKNGDVIQLCQNLEVTMIPTYDYFPGEVPETSEELQDFLDEIIASVESNAEVTLYLPAVTYDGPLVIRDHPVNLYGTSAGDRRTVFTAPLRVEAEADSQISYIQEIDFQGNGSGTALSAAARVRTDNCTFSNWETGFYGTAWVNAVGCTFTDNETAFHFNSASSSASHSMYNNNMFRNNGTAVLLENVPTDLTLNFENSVFTGNRTDIDNRCDQPLDLSQAIFEALP